MILDKNNSLIIIKINIIINSNPINSFKIIITNNNNFNKTLNNFNSKDNSIRAAFHKYNKISLFRINNNIKTLLNNFKIRFIYKRVIAIWGNKQNTKLIEKILL